MTKQTRHWFPNKQIKQKMQIHPHRVNERKMHHTYTPQMEMINRKKKEMILKNQTKKWGTLT